MNRMIWCVDGDCYLSGDGGATWELISSPEPSRSSLLGILGAALVLAWWAARWLSQGARVEG